MRADRKITLIITSISIALVLCAVSVAYSQSYNIIQLTNNSYNDTHPKINNNGFVVWNARIGSEYWQSEIFRYDGTTTVQLTNNDYGDHDPEINDNGFVVWIGYYDDSWSEIFLYNGSNTVRLTENDYGDYHPQINNNNYVVWSGVVGSNEEIFLYNGTTTKQLTTTQFNERDALINENNSVVWWRYDPYTTRQWELFFYNGTTTIQLSDDLLMDDYGYCTLNNSNSVVWATYDDSPEADCEIMLFDGATTTQLTDNDYHELRPKINNNGFVVWVGYDGADSEIFLFNGTTTTQLTNNTYPDSNPQINDSGFVVWNARIGLNWEIFLYDGTTTTQLTDGNRDDLFPQINNKGYVVWESSLNIGNSEIFLAIPEEDSDGDGIPDDQDFCRDEDATGFDADEDGCIDSIYGLESMIESLVEGGVIDEQMENSILSKIDNAAASYNKENICTAINQLEALISQVNAQRGKKISTEAADDIIAYTNSVISWYLDQLPEGESC